MPLVKPVPLSLPLVLVLGSGAFLLMASAPPVPGGEIGTLALGEYSCELPGDAGGPTKVPVADYDFIIVNSSSYRSQGVRGSYLRTGNDVVMTGGTLAGLKLRRMSDSFLRQIMPDGSLGEMRCILTRHHNS